MRAACAAQGLRKLRTAGLVVRRGQGGRVDPFRYMIKSAFNALSPEAQRAPLLPEDDDAPGGTAGATQEAAEQADVAAGLDLAPCSVEALPEESADSSCDAADAAAAPQGMAVLASPPAHQAVTPAWCAAVTV